MLRHHDVYWTSPQLHRHIDGAALTLPPPAHLLQFVPCLFSNCCPSVADGKAFIHTLDGTELAAINLSRPTTSTPPSKESRAAFLHFL